MDEFSSTNWTEPDACRKQNRNEESAPMKLGDLIQRRKRREWPRNTLNRRHYSERPDGLENLKVRMCVTRVYATPWAKASIRIAPFTVWRCTEVPPTPNFPWNSRGV